MQPAGPPVAVCGHGRGQTFTDGRKAAGIDFARDGVIGIGLKAPRYGGSGQGAGGCGSVGRSRGQSSHPRFFWLGCVRFEAGSINQDRWLARKIRGLRFLAAFFFGGARHIYYC